MKLNLQDTAFVFPGQGSQTVGMGKDLAAQYPIAKQTFEEASFTNALTVENFNPNFRN